MKTTTSRGRRPLDLSAAALAAAMAWTVACAPGPLWAQQQDARARIERAFPADAAARIEAVVEEAAREGIPSEPLYDKALEGAAKRVPPPRVVDALTEYAGRLGRARDLVGPEVGTPWMVAGADALRRGVTPGAVRDVVRESRARSPMALVVLGDLVETGVREGRALDLVRQAIAGGPRDDDLLAVPAALRRLVRQGDTTPEAARRILRALREGHDVRRIRDRPPSGPDARRIRARPVPPGSEPTRGDVRTRRDRPPDRTRRPASRS